jgi:hypothetical protein
VLTREEWLLNAKDYLEKEFFNKSNRSLPKVALSCGIPRGSIMAIGQCWDPKVASDGTTHVFVCPSVDEPYEVLHILLHELCHAVVGVSHGHNQTFGRMARAVGLKGKLTHTNVPKESDTGKILLNIAGVMGDYPHKSLNKLSKKKKSDKEKMITLISPDKPSYKLSIKLALLDEHGPPTDPWGSLMETKA